MNFLSTPLESGFASANLGLELPKGLLGVVTTGPSDATPGCPPERNSTSAKKPTAPTQPSPPSHHLPPFPWFLSLYVFLQIKFC